MRRASSAIAANGEASEVATTRKPGRQLDDLVAVAHPHLLARAGLEHALEQGAAVLHVDERAAELAVMADLDLAAELGADGLHAVADAEDRHAQLEHRRGRARRPASWSRPARRRG